MLHLEVTYTTPCAIGRDSKAKLNTDKQSTTMAITLWSRACLWWRNCSGSCKIPLRELEWLNLAVFEIFTILQTYDCYSGTRMEASSDFTSFQPLFSKLWFLSSEAQDQHLLHLFFLKRHIGHNIMMHLVQAVNKLKFMVVSWEKRPWAAWNLKWSMSCGQWQEGGHKLG